MTEPTSSVLLERVEVMRNAYAGKDWGLLKNFFTENVFYKPGAAPETRGVQPIIDSFKALYEIYAVDDMSPTRTWQVEDTVIIEYNMQVTRLSDKKSIKFPCVDIYQFTGDRISDWRVYPLHAKFAVSDD